MPYLVEAGRATAGPTRSALCVCLHLRGHRARHRQRVRAHPAGRQRRGHADVSRGIRQDDRDDEHVALVLDGAGWHGGKALCVPPNITLVPLPPYSPELNPVERVWLYLKERFLSLRLHNDYTAIVAATSKAWKRLRRDWTPRVAHGIPLDHEGQTIGSMVSEATAGRRLPSEVIERIVDRADGVPLFIEELTKTVVESGVLRAEGDRYELTGPLPAYAIPGTFARPPSWHAWIDWRPPRTWRRSLPPLAATFRMP